MGYSDLVELVQAAGAGSSAPAKPPSARRRSSQARCSRRSPRPGKILCSGINYASHKQGEPDAVFPTALLLLKTAERIDRSRRANRDPRADADRLRSQPRLSSPDATRVSRPRRSGMSSATVLNDSARISSSRTARSARQASIPSLLSGRSSHGRRSLTAGAARLSYLRGGRCSRRRVRHDLPPPACSVPHRDRDALPGDVVSTGTPAGVGAFRKPRVDAAGRRDHGRGRPDRPPHEQSSRAERPGRRLRGRSVQNWAGRPHRTFGDAVREPPSSGRRVPTSTSHPHEQLNLVVNGVLCSRSTASSTGSRQDTATRSPATPTRCGPRAGPAAGRLSPDREDYRQRVAKLAG